MEDYSFMRKAYNDIWIGAVFDGHGGCEVAHFLKKHFYDLITTNDSFAKGQYVKAIE